MTDESGPLSLFKLGSDVPLKIFPPNFLAEACECAERLLKSNHCTAAFLNNVAPDFIEGSYEKGLAKTYTIKLIKNTLDMNAYVCIYPTELDEIFINPLLAINIYRDFARLDNIEAASFPEDFASGLKEGAESSADNSGKLEGVEVIEPSILQPTPSQRRQHAIYFLGVKLAHGVWNLIHRLGSKIVRDTNKTPTKVKQDNIEGEIIPVTYADMGYIVEHDALHGLWEITTSSKDYMKIDAVVIYPSLQPCSAAFLDSDLTRITESSIDIRVIGRCTGEIARQSESGYNYSSEGSGGISSSGEMLSKW